MAIGILWTMMSIFSISCKASSPFSKEQVLGVLATGIDNQVCISWEVVENASGYVVYEASHEADFYLVANTNENHVALSERERGMTYRYYIVSYQKKGSDMIYGKKSETVSTTVPQTGRSTIKNFLKVAIRPIGSTMYVWGGGWNKADTAAGTEAKQIGLSKRWRAFAAGKKNNYNYRNYRYKIHDGLDCSGYVGWCVYNILNTKNGKKGYVYSASKQAKKFSDMGFGGYKKSSAVRNYKAGDIMSSTCSCCGHVYIVIGACDDGSIVIAHASPAGVQLSGTVSKAGKKNSKALKLAKKYMKKYHPDWYKKYPELGRGTSYLAHYAQMRWDINHDNGFLSDPDGYTRMSAEEILKDLYCE